MAKILGGKQISQLSLFDYINGITIGSIGAELATSEWTDTILSDNIFDLEKRAGCSNVLSLRGSIYQNRCPKCGQEYPMEYIRDSKKTPRCRNCNNVVRPGVTLYGEQLDSHLTSLAATEVEKAEVLLLLGTKLSSDVYSNYVKFFEGEQIVVIHEKEHYTDCKADIVIYDQPGKVLSNLGYDF